MTLRKHIQALTNTVLVHNTLSYAISTQGHPKDPGFQLEHSRFLPGETLQFISHAITISLSLTIYFIPCML